MLFSRRKGYIKAKDVIQIDTLEDSTKIQIWSMLHENVFTLYHSIRGSGTRGSNLEQFVIAYWINVFEKPTDTIPSDINDAIKMIREFYNKSEWYIALDTLEIAVQNLPSGIYPYQFQDIVNNVLERENVGYRMINGRITQITDQNEINEIDSALKTTKGPVQNHLQNSLKLLTDRKKPDFRNSIKESISAIEALVKINLEDESATLGKLLKRFDFHPALKKGLSAIYGYTSDAHGIRHALLEEDSITYGDAKFFLVICSAFINLIESKS